MTASLFYFEDSENQPFRVSSPFPPERTAAKMGPLAKKTTKGKLVKPTLLLHFMIDGSGSAGCNECKEITSKGVDYICSKVIILT